MFASGRSEIVDAEGGNVAAQAEANREVAGLSWEIRSRLACEVKAEGATSSRRRACSWLRVGRGQRCGAIAKDTRLAMCNDGGKFFESAVAVFVLWLSCIRVAVSLDRCLVEKIGCNGIDSAGWR